MGGEEGSVRQAVPFHDLYRLDRMKRVLVLELLFSAGVVAVAVGLRSDALHHGLAVLAAVSSVIAALWIRWELGRKRRKLAVGTVLRTLDLVRGTEVPRFHVIAGNPVPRGQQAPGPVRGFVVDAEVNGTRIRYIDHSPRSRGERVLLLLDGKGEVIASAGSESRVPLELLMKLA